MARAARRLAGGIVTAWAAVTLTFFGLRISAGDPVASLLAQGLASPQQAQELRHSLGLDRPLVEQYLAFLGGLLRGDLGRSLYTGRPVLRVVAEQASPSAALAGSGLAIAVAIGLLLGVTAGWNSGRLVGRAAGAAAAVVGALPVAFTGILALLLAVSLQSSLTGQLPAAARRLLLPALVLGIASSGSIARVVQFGLIESLRAPYILAAKARGMRVGGRLLWHALRPSVAPAISLVGLQAAFLFGGTVVTETVFSRPGLGRLLVSAILQGDYPVAQALVALAAILYTVTQLLSDAAAATVDPRIWRHT